MIQEVSKTVTELTSTEPVTRTEVKTHMNVTDTGWDSEIDTLITECRKALENYTGRSFIYKRIELYCDYSAKWWLPYGPFIGLEGVGNKDATVGSGIPSFTTIEDYSITGGDFPQIDLPICDNLIKITYTVGYTTLPPNLKLALLNEIYFRFENKGQTRGSGICDEARVLAAPYVRLEWQ